MRARVPLHVTDKGNWKSGKWKLMQPQDRGSISSEHQAALRQREEVS